MGHAQHTPAMVAAMAMARCVMDEDMDAPVQNIGGRNAPDPELGHGRHCLRSGRNT